LLLTDILFYDTSYVGDWSVPLENNVRSISEYTNICLDCGFEVNAIDDITLDSWYPFCDYLGEQQGNVAFTSKLKKSVAAYIMVDLSLK
jgi:MPBQ/MSBQ methyltransferase